MGLKEKIREELDRVADNIASMCERKKVANAIPRKGDWVYRDYPHICRGDKDKLLDAIGRVVSEGREDTIGVLTLSGKQDTWGKDWWTPFYPPKELTDC